MLPHPFFWGHYWDWYNLIVYPLAIIFPVFFFYFDKKHYATGFDFTEQLVIIFIAVMLGFIASKAFGIFEFYIWRKEFPHSLSQFLKEFSEYNGTRWFGGLFIELILFYFLIPYYDKEKGDKLLYIASLFLMMAVALGKMGCFFSGHNGCCGSETDLPWGVYYRYGAAYCGKMLHPLQVYDAIVYFIGFIFLLIKYQQRNVRYCYVVFMFVSVCGFFSQYLNPTNISLYHFTVGQYTYILIFTMSTFAYLRYNKAIKTHIQ